MCVAARHYAVIWKQLLFANKRNRVRWVVLGLSQDGACTDLSENFSEDSLKGDLSNDNIVSPPLFSLVNTFKWFRKFFLILYCMHYVPLHTVCYGDALNCIPYKY